MPTRSAAPRVPTAQRIRGWHPEEVLNHTLVRDERIYAFAMPDLVITLADEWWVAALGLAGGTFLVAAGAPSLAVVVVVGALVFMLWRALEAWYTRYVLTSFRVLRLSGVLSRNVEFIPWRKVTDVSMQRSPLQRVIGASTIRIESANEASQFRAMSDVRDPLVFFATLQEVMAAFSGRVEVADLRDVDVPRHGPAALVVSSRPAPLSEISIDRDEGPPTGRIPTVDPPGFDPDDVGPPDFDPPGRHGPD